MVNWWPIAPYIYKKEVDVKGSLKNLVELLIRDCCGECVNFQYANPANDSEALKNEIGSLKFIMHNKVGTYFRNKIYLLYSLINKNSFEQGF